MNTSNDHRWLDTQQQAAWRDFLEGVARFQEVLVREHDRRLPFSVPEYDVLVQLSEQPDRSLRMSRLAERLAYSRSRVTHTVSRMERAGLVRRVAAAEDKRGVHCSMTDAGWHALVAAAPTHVDIVRTYLVDVLTRDELLSLGNAMARVRDACATALA